jgi:hypothetical protein
VSRHPTALNKTFPDILVTLKVGVDAATGQGGEYATRYVVSVVLDGAPENTNMAGAYDDENLHVP